MSGVRLDRDGRQDRRESRERNPEENIERAHVVPAMRPRHKDTFRTPVEARIGLASGKVRSTSQGVAPVDQNSLIGGKTLFFHGGRTGCVRTSGEAGGGTCPAIASSRRPERICSLSCVRRPPTYFVARSEERRVGKECRCWCGGCA